MTATNEPQPARVNDEDRQALRGKLDQLWGWAKSGKQRDPDGGVYYLMDVENVDSFTDHVERILVSHGWGPRPRVSPTKLGEFIDAANAGGMAVPWHGLQEYLRECGIEVTDGE